MPMKTLGTVRDKDNRHLSRIEVVMVHKLMEEKAGRCVIGSIDCGASRVYQLSLAN
ncbi:unnamed protein product [Penicillium camemberti]|uniref:Str. FM013 n=1 Tax=Penicillium camemberti (strain FM 013) TaxID=1429867 RepID=A0A0G4NSU8_PENC3|nr:unnamed protein product [Penicillium camemberti]